RRLAGTPMSTLMIPRSWRITRTTRRLAGTARTTRRIPRSSRITRITRITRIISWLHRNRHACYGEGHRISIVFDTDQEPNLPRRRVGDPIENAGSLMDRCATGGSDEGEEEFVTI